MVIIAAVSTLASVFLASTAQGIAVFMVFGAGLVAGLLGQIGDAIASRTLERISEVAIFAVPFEALYQEGLYLLTSDQQGLTGTVVQLGPFGGAQESGAGPGRVGADLHGGGGRRSRWPDSGAATSEVDARLRDSAADGRHPLPPRALRAAGRRAGRRRGPGRACGGCSTSASTRPASEEAIAAAEAHEAVFAAVGRHPNGSTGFDDAAAARIEELAAHPRVAAVGETGLDFYRDNAPRDDQRHAFAAHIEIARRVAKPLVIHVRDGGATTDGEALAETFEILRAEAVGVTVILHCFSAPPERAAEAAEWGWYCSFAGNVTYPKSEPLREAARRGARRAAAGRDRRARSSSPQPVRGRPNEPANVVATAEALAERPRRPLRRARGDRGGERGPRLRLVMRPVVRLGQNFLADPNLLAAIVREAEPGPDDVVLEVGGGEGALTAALAPRVATGARDRARRAAAPGARGGRGRARQRRASLRRRDAARPGGARPRADRMVANLPYSIATPLLLRTIAELARGRGVDADGPARDRRPAARGARLAHLRRRRACSCSSPARCGCCARSTGRCSRRGRGSTRR